MGCPETWRLSLFTLLELAGGREVACVYKLGPSNEQAGGEEGSAEQRARIQAGKASLTLCSM